MLSSILRLNQDVKVLIPTVPDCDQSHYQIANIDIATILFFSAWVYIPSLSKTLYGASCLSVWFFSFIVGYKMTKVFFLIYLNNTGTHTGVYVSADTL